MANLERYVSTKGDDKPGNGTKDHPFRTIQHAAKDLSENRSKGQTGVIFVDPGIYEEVVVLSEKMQLVRSDLAEGVSVFPSQGFYTEKGPAVVIRRPQGSSGPAQSSGAPTWPEVIKVEGKDVLIQGIRIEGDSRPQRGIFIHFSESVSITGCVITGNYSKMLYTGKGSGSEADPFHSDPTDEGEGAGIRIFKSKKVTIQNSVFLDNKTELKYKQEVTDEELAILESNHKYQLADAVGKVSDADKKRLRQAVPVRSGGGHVSCFEADEIRFQNCHFEDGYAGGRGGAIQFAHKGYGQCTSCFFRRNEAGVDGGAVCFSDPDPDDYGRKPISFTKCTFDQNRSGDDGGAVYLTTKAQATFSQCIFKNNTASSNGGGLRVSFGSSATLENCEFKGNRANIDAMTKTERNQDGGGAIAVNNSSLEMKGGTIEGNSVTGFAGGGVYFITASFNEGAEAVADMTHGHTFDDILKKGYGVTSVHLKLKDVTFKENSASGETCNQNQCVITPRTGFQSRAAGGAIYALQALDKFNVPVTVVLDGVQIIRNVATHVEEKQRADIVIRHVKKLVIKGCKIERDVYNRYAASFINVADGDLSGSPELAEQRAAGMIFEDGGSLHY